MERKIVGLVAAIVLVVAVAGGYVYWTLPQPKPEVEPIKIGFFTGVSGPAALHCTRQVQAATVAVDDINAQGGVLGRPVRLIVADDQGDPLQGIACYRRLATVDKVHIAVGSSWSSVTLPVLPETNVQKLVLFNAVCTHPDLGKLGGKGGNPYLFKLKITDDYFFAVFMDVLIRSVKAKTFYVLARDDDWGRACDPIIKKYAERFGGTVVGSAFYQVGETEFTPYLTKIKALKPDGIIPMASVDEDVMILKQWAALGLKDLGVNIYARSFEAGDWSKKLGWAVIEGVYGLAQYSMWLDTPKNKWFVEEYQKKTGVAPGINEGLVAMGMYIIRDAIKAAGSTNSEAIRAALAKGPFNEQITGMSLKFNEYNSASGFVQVYKIEKGKGILIVSKTLEEIQL